MSNVPDMNEKENWIERQLNHQDFLQRSVASDELKARLRSIPMQVGTRTFYVPKRIIWTIAAGIALLITVNLISLAEYHSSDSSNATSSQDAYFSYLQNL